MYKIYDTEDYISALDEAAEKVRALFTDRSKEISRMQHIIDNDYPFEDLFLRQAKIEYEKNLLQKLNLFLDEETKSMKEKVAIDMGIKLLDL